MSTPPKPVSISYDGDGEPVTSSSWRTSEWPVETGILIECLIPHLLHAQSPPPSEASVTEPQTALESPSRGDIMLNKLPMENNGLTNMSDATSSSMPNNTFQDCSVENAISSEQINQRTFLSLPYHIVSPPPVMNITPLGRVLISPIHRGPLSPVAMREWWNDVRKCPVI
ncbi:unnamed protein product [Angiostrongylus costaricensis]|uniref:Uncharacterized protein n=1 Tax=Angiostrongylus costaricensis TaxID=334426 RepID=A0A0R3PZG1_ANGCS|nr:unnamed protein product [Angiostrongylus costaricensis]